MSRVTAREKALALLADGRIRFRREDSNAHRMVFYVVGDTDPFTPYVTTIEYDGGVRVESCTCEGGQHHPIRARCSHAIAARIVCDVLGAPKEG